MTYAARHVRRPDPATLPGALQGVADLLEEIPARGDRAVTLTGWPQLASAVSGYPVTVTGPVGR
jgi:hypothetical protein